MKKHCLSFVLSFILCLPLWGQLNIVGVNTEKPETTIDYLNKPLIIDNLLPKYSLQSEFLLGCIPEGQRLFCSTMNFSNFAYSIIDDQIFVGLPSGYYKYVGVLLYWEQIAPLFERICKNWGKMRTLSGETLNQSQWDAGEYYFQTCNNRIYTLAELKEQFATSDASKLNPSNVWCILENSEGKQFYIYPYFQRYDDYLVLDYYDAIVNSLKGKEVALYLYRFHNTVTDYYTGTSIPVDKLLFSPHYYENSDYESYKNTTYYSAKDIIVDLKEKDGESSIHLLVVLNDSKGNTFSQEIPTALAFSSYRSMICMGHNPHGPDYHIITRDSLQHCIDVRIQSIKEKEELARLEKQKKAKAEQIRRDKIIQQYGEEMGNLILKGKLALGMTPEMCKASIGHPTQSYRTTTALGTVMVYQYAFMVLTFSNDKLISVTEAD